MTYLALALALGSIVTHFLAIWWLAAPLAWLAYQAFSVKDEQEEDYIVEGIELEDEQ